MIAEIIKQEGVKGELIGRLVTPRKLLLCWEVSELPKKVLELFFSVNFEQLVPIVRIYDITDLSFNGKNAHYYHEMAVPYQNGQWFINGLASDRSYAAELGVYFSNSDFFPLLRSNCIQTPAHEIPNGEVLNAHLLSFQQDEPQKPKWMDHVSTYSYYEETKCVEKKDE
ncbi:DUF4912 domain-containing protein [Neobacillus soli]|uniref:DUF4912 domain-containing protein n=1 Tax=Neobacillus soli TaxID=220688 RepID=UPI00082712DB|nr:DUF4912 domain-containing protein [Neobacillus soli]